jgi:hypothetical protein
MCSVMTCTLLPRVCGNREMMCVRKSARIMCEKREFSTLYLKASSFRLHQEVMNGYKFQEG